MEEPILKKKSLINRIIKNQLFVTITTSMLLVFIVVGSSYAIFNNNSNKPTNDVVIQSGELKVILSSDINEAIEINYTTLGVSDEVGLATTPYTFTVENTGSGTVVYYEIRIVDKEYENSTLPHKSLNYAIKVNDNEYTEPHNLGDNGSYIYTGRDLEVGETDSFELKLWVNEEFGKYANNKELRASIEITLYSDMPQFITYDVNGGSGVVTKTAVSSHKITESTPTKEDYAFAGWSESKNATKATYKPGDEYPKNSGTTLYAVYSQALYDFLNVRLSSYLLPDDGEARIVSGGGGYNDGNPVPDSNLKNYVWYSGKLWRIVALNNDGTIKLVTEDIITTIIWGSNTTYKGSWIYQWLNEDFLDTLYNYENIIVTDYEWNLTETTATTKPAKTTMVEAAVGLLTAYEYTQSYSKLGTSDSAKKNGYLNNGYYWWLMTPYSSFFVRYVVYNGNLHYDGPKFNPRGGRPSINLSSNIKIKGNGDGSRGNPYLLEGDITKPTNNVTKLNERVSGEYLKFDNKLYRIVNIENGITKITKADYIKDGDTVVRKYFSSTVNFGSVNNETCIDGKITYTADGSTYTRNCNEHWDYYLNNDWYNNISTSPINYKGMIIEGVWYLGQYGSETSYKNTICATSNTTETTKNCTRTTAKYEGYVGLGRAGEPFTSQIGTGYSNSSIIWTITPYSSSLVRNVDDYGYLNFYSGSFGGRPSINLSSNVIITDGLGTEDKPFEIDMPSGGYDPQ